MLKKFLRYYRPHRFLFIITMIIAFLSSILTIVYPIMTRNLLKTHIPNKDFQACVALVGIMLIAMVLQTVFQFIRMKWGHILGVRIEADMRSDIFFHLQKLSFNYFDNVKTGHIMSRISNDLNKIAEVAHHAPEDFIISIISIISSFIVMFHFNVKLSIIALIPLPLLIIWGLTYGRKMRGGFRKVRKKIADINSSVENSVQGIREVKAYANESLEQEKFEHVNYNFRSAKENMYGIMAAFFSGMTFLTEFYYVAVISGGVYLIYTNQLLVADLVAFTLFINFMLKPINRMISFVEQFQQGGAAFERFVEIMEIEPEIADKSKAVDLKNVKGKITIEKITFKYPTSPDDVLRDISINIPVGKTIALVGESGAGKSSLVSLIPRFYEAQKGKILIDENNIMDVTQASLRNNIGLVQQSPFLFDSTIKENIIYGKPNASDDEVLEAAKKAKIYDFIKTLPEGIYTKVGEHGVKLSGGQKQRISIARAFLKNPPILIFDEATSSLDTKSEMYIQQAMEKLSENRTTIIIAHRLSTVKNADMLYVMKDGRVVETGNHHELLEQKGYYHSLYTRNIL